MEEKEAEIEVEGEDRRIGKNAGTRARSGTNWRRQRTLFLFQQRLKHGMETIDLFFKHQVVICAGNPSSFFTQFLPFYKKAKILVHEARKRALQLIVKVDRAGAVELALLNLHD